MALTPHVNDKNRKEVLQTIEKIQNKGTEQAADELKGMHNMGEKENVKVATPAQTEKVAATKNK